MVVTYDAIVDETDPIFVVEVRMRINISLITMSGPSCMTDPDVMIM